MDLDFPPGMPLEIRMDLTDAARGTGLPLWQLELLGQDEAIASAFIQAARRGGTTAFMGEVQWDVLEARYQARKRSEKGHFWQRPNITPTFPEVLPITLLLGAAGARGGRN